MPTRQNVILSTALGVLVWTGIAQAVPRDRDFITEFVYRDLVVAVK